VVVLKKKGRQSLSHDEWDTVLEHVFLRESLVPPDATFTTQHPTHDFLPPDLKTRIQTRPPPELRELSIDRRIYCARLLDKALASGVEFRDNTPVVDVILDGDVVVGVKVQLASGATEEVRGKIIAGASGPAGIIRRRLPPSFNIPRDLEPGNVIYGYRAYYNKVGSPARAHVNILGFGNRRGLAWVNTGGEYVDVLLTTFYPEEVSQLPSRVDELRARFSFIGTELKRGGHTAPIITRRMFDQVVGNGFILVGDAGCMGNAITGSGILGSIIAARRATPVVARAITSGDVSKAALWPYAAEFVHEIGAYFASAHYFALSLFSVEFDTINFAFCQGVINARDLEAGVTWQPLALGAGDVLGKLFRAWPRLGTVIKLGLSLADVPKVFQHWKNYPKTWDPRVMATWSTKNHQLFGTLEGRFQDTLARENPVK
jgi:flavin-dependent dehydrogenase